jgi:hypothetical protein
MSSRIEERTEEMPSWLAKNVRHTLAGNYRHAMFLTHRTPLAGLLKAWSATVDDYARQIADSVVAGEDPSVWLPAYRLATSRRDRAHERLSARVAAAKAARAVGETE